MLVVTEKPIPVIDGVISGGGLINEDKDEFFNRLDYLFSKKNTKKIDDLMRTEKDDPTKPTYTFYDILQTLVINFNENKNQSIKLVTIQKYINKFMMNPKGYLNLKEYLSVLKSNNKQKSFLYLFISNGMKISQFNSIILNCKDIMQQFEKNIEKHTIQLVEKESNLTKKQILNDPGAEILQPHLIKIKDMKYDMEKMIPRGKCLDSFFQAGIGSDKATVETFAEISQFFNVKGDNTTFNMKDFDEYYKNLSKNKLGEGKKKRKQTKKRRKNKRKQTNKKQRKQTNKKKRKQTNKKKRKQTNKKKRKQTNKKQRKQTNKKSTRRQNLSLINI